MKGSWTVCEAQRGRRGAYGSNPIANKLKNFRSSKIRAEEKATQRNAVGQEEFSGSSHAGELTPVT